MHVEMQGAPSLMHRMPGGGREGCFRRGEGRRRWVNGPAVEHGCWIGGGGRSWEGPWSIIWPVIDAERGWRDCALGLLGRGVSNYGGRQLALELIQPRVRGLLLAGWPRGRALAGPGHHLRQLPGFPKGDLRGRTLRLCRLFGLRGLSAGNWTGASGFWCVKSLILKGYHGAVDEIGGAKARLSRAELQRGRFNKGVLIMGFW